MASASSNPIVTIGSAQNTMRVPRRRIAELVAFVARHEKTALAEVDIAVVDARTIARMNRQYLGHAGATDVLSFDLSESGSALSAQIVVCSDVAVREARSRGLAPQRELLRYVLHGLLHLTGYDDRTPADSATMTTRQEELLAEFLKR